jgi:hypothetical protein
MAIVDLGMATDWTGGLVMSMMGMMLAWTAVQQCSMVFALIQLWGQVPLLARNRHGRHA